MSAVDSPAALTAMAGWVLAGGLWTTLVGGHLARGLPTSDHDPSRGGGRVLRAGPGAPGGVITHTVHDWTDSRNRWWLLLIAFVIVQPYFAAGLARAATRVVDVLAGTVLAAVIAHELRDLPLVLVALSLVLTGIAVRVLLRSPFWIVPLFLTPPSCSRPRAARTSWSRPTSITRCSSSWPRWRRSRSSWWAGGSWRSACTPFPELRPRVARPRRGFRRRCRSRPRT
ncbi:FUSC family protein [Oerskovia sp. M15]